MEMEPSRGATRRQSSTAARKTFASPWMLFATEGWIVRMEMTKGDVVRDLLTSCIGLRLDK